jgi:hypothetical protein
LLLDPAERGGIHETQGFYAHEQGEPRGGQGGRALRDTPLEFSQGMLAAQLVHHHRGDGQDDPLVEGETGQLLRTRGEQFGGHQASSISSTSTSTPTFLYESLWDLGIFLVLVLLLRPRLRRDPGALFFCYIGFYSIGRFAVEALRLDSFWLGDFRVPQIASVVGLAVAVVGLARVLRRSKQST